MKKLEEVELKIVMFESDDIIVASGGGCPTDYCNNGYGGKGGICPSVQFNS